MQVTIVAAEADELELLVREAVATEVRSALSRLEKKLEQQLQEFVGTKNVLTHKQVARYLGDEVSPQTVLRYIKSEGLAATKIGRVWYVSRQDLESWLTFPSKQE